MDCIYVKNICLSLVYKMYIMNLNLVCIHLILTDAPVAQSVKRFAANSQVPSSIPASAKVAFFFPFFDFILLKELSIMCLGLLEVRSEQKNVQIYEISIRK